VAAGLLRSSVAPVCCRAQLQLEPFNNKLWMPRLPLGYWVTIGHAQHMLMVSGLRPHHSSSQQHANVLNPSTQTRLASTYMPRLGPTDIKAITQVHRLAPVACCCINFVHVAHAMIAILNML
jgi:hypothetical protein